MRTYVRTAGHGDHIAYPLVRNALESGNLAYLRQNADRIRLTLRDAVAVCGMIADEEPDKLEQALDRWIRRFANEARNPQAQDYSAIVACFDAMQHDPELAEYQLTELCAERGIDQ